MAERMGANGLPIVKKVKTWEDLQNESTGTLQEILQVNPNSSPVEEVEDEAKYDPMGGGLPSPPFPHHKRPL